MGLHYFNAVYDNANTFTNHTVSNRTQSNLGRYKTQGTSQDIVLPGTQKQP